MKRRAGISFRRVKRAFPFNRTAAISSALLLSVAVLFFLGLASAQSQQSLKCVQVGGNPLDNSTSQIFVKSGYPSFLNLFNVFSVNGASGNVGIGTANTGAKLEVVGNVNISGAGNGVIFPDGTKQTTSGGGGGNQWTTNGNDIQNANAGNVLVNKTVYIPQTSPPASPVRGQLYFDASANTFKYYDGTKWKYLDNSYMISLLGYAGTAHTRQDCVNAGGEMTTISGDGANTEVCKFTAGSCPGGWSQAGSWDSIDGSKTSSTGCGSGYPDPGVCGFGSCGSTCCTATAPSYPWGMNPSPQWTSSCAYRGTWVDGYYKTLYCSPSDIAAGCPCTYPEYIKCTSSGEKYVRYLYDEGGSKVYNLYNLQSDVGTATSGASVITSIGCK